MIALTWSAAEFLREMMEPGPGMTPQQQRHAEELLTALSGGVWTPDTRHLGEPSERTTVRCHYGTVGCRDRSDNSHECHRSMVPA